MIAQLIAHWPSLLCIYTLSVVLALCICTLSVNLQMLKFSSAVIVRDQDNRTGLFIVSVDDHEVQQRGIGASAFFHDKLYVASVYWERRVSIQKP